MSRSSAQGVLDRFTQIKPKVIFSVEAVRYNGKVHDHTEKLKNVVAGACSLSVHVPILADFDGCMIGLRSNL